jgi:hypothetical protein
LRETAASSKRPAIFHRAEQRFVKTLYGPAAAGQRGMGGIGDHVESERSGKSEYFEQWPSGSGSVGALIGAPCKRWHPGPLRGHAAWRELGIGLHRHHSPLRWVDGGNLASSATTVALRIAKLCKAAFAPFALLYRCRLKRLKAQAPSPLASLQKFSAIDTNCGRF